MRRRNNTMDTEQTEPTTEQTDTEPTCIPVLILKPGHYVVRSDRTLLCNVSNGQPQRFGGFGAAKAVAAALCASTLTVTIENFAWGE